MCVWSACGPGGATKTRRDGLRAAAAANTPPALLSWRADTRIGCLALSRRDNTNTHTQPTMLSPKQYRLLRGFAWATGGELAVTSG